MDAIELIFPKNTLAQKPSNRYKDLAKVEMPSYFQNGIRGSIRPIFVRKGSRTRGHVFVCMLAYKLIQNYAVH